MLLFRGWYAAYSGIPTTVRWKSLVTNPVHYTNVNEIQCTRILRSWASRGHAGRTTHCTVPRPCLPLKRRHEYRLRVCFTCLDRRCPPYSTPPPPRCHLQRPLRRCPGACSVKAEQIVTKKWWMDWWNDCRNSTDPLEFWPWSHHERNRDKKTICRHSLKKKTETYYRQRRRQEGKINKQLRTKR